jgi:hypothetical protein
MAQRVGVVGLGGIGAGQAAQLAHQSVMTVDVTALLGSPGKAAGVDTAVLECVLQSGLANSAPTPIPLPKGGSVEPVLNYRPIRNDR